MAIRNVVKIGDEILRKTAKKVMAFDENLWQILDDMRETMHQNDGMGLAGPQIGILKQIVVMEVNGAYFEMINPQIISQSEQTFEDEEGCLSVPKKREVVARPKKLTVRFYDRYGTEMTITGEDIFARCVCHEVDHLHGILFVDKAKKE